MKKLSKILLAVGISVFTIGFLLLVGAKVWYSVNPSAVDKDYEFKTHTESYTGIQNIEISANMCDVRFEKGEDFLIYFEAVMGDSIRSEFKDGVLKITETPRDVTDLAMFVLWQGRYRPDYEPCIRIIIPENKDFDIITVSSEKGDISGNYIKADEVSFITVSSDVDITGLSADKFGITAQNGKISVVGKVSKDISVIGGKGEGIYNLSGKTDLYGYYINPTAPIIINGQGYAEPYTSDEADGKDCSVFIKSGEGKIIFNMNEGRENE